MLTASRAFGQNVKSSPPLPRVEELAPLYDELGVVPRRGQVIMIVGRPGAQKSGFAMFWIRKMGLPTLYMSGDMTPFEATSRLVSMETGRTTEEVEEGIRSGDIGVFTEALNEIPITFAFGQPITWSGIEAELLAWVELHNSFPEIICIDNLMDIEEAESDYQTQQAALQALTSLARITGSTVIVVHHATDKSNSSDLAPGDPPPRRDVKNGLAEKPQLTLGVAFEPVSRELRIACLKQRMGPSDPSGKNYVRLDAQPEYTRYYPRKRLH